MKAIIYLAGVSAYALGVQYHTGFSGVAHQFIRSPKHNAHIYGGRELELAEFNKIAEEIFGAKEDVYYKPCARLIAEEGDGVDDTKRAQELAAALEKATEDFATVTGELESTITDLRAKLEASERQVTALLQSKATDRPAFVPENSPVEVEQPSPTETAPTVAETPATVAEPAATVAEAPVTAAEPAATETAAPVTEAPADPAPAKRTSNKRR